MKDSLPYGEELYQQLSEPSFWTWLCFHPMMRLRNKSWQEWTVLRHWPFDFSTDLNNLFSASLCSGFLSSFVSLPFDNAKTKIQKMKQMPDGSFPYKNIFDAMSKTVKNEGVSKLWVGFPTFYFRIAPHVCITLITQDFLTDLVNRMRNKKHWSKKAIHQMYISIYLCLSNRLWYNFL